MTDIVMISFIDTVCHDRPLFKVLSTISVSETEIEDDIGRFHKPTASIVLKIKEKEDD